MPRKAKCKWTTGAKRQLPFCCNGLSSGDHCVARSSVQNVHDNGNVWSCAHRIKLLAKTHTYNIWCWHSFTLNLHWSDTALYTSYPRCLQSSQSHSPYLMLSKSLGNPPDAVATLLPQPSGNWPTGLLGGLGTPPFPWPGAVAPSLSHVMTSMRIPKKKHSGKVIATYSASNPPRSKTGLTYMSLA